MNNITTPPDGEIEGELLDSREWKDGREVIFYDGEGEWIQASSSSIISLDEME